MIAGMAAQAAAAAGTSLAAVCFTAVLSLARDHLTADARCPRCGRRPAAAVGPLGPLTAEPLARENRERTSGRTKTERRKRATGEATDDITTTLSNLPKADTSPTT